MKLSAIESYAKFPLDSIELHAFEESSSVSGRFGQISLRSAFQPIYSLAHRRVVGFEALVRPFEEGRLVSPLILFDRVQEDAESVFLDRLCRLVHVRNFLGQGDGDSWLFLNINPKVTVIGRRYGTFFAELLERFGISPHRVVVEILESQIQDEALLSEAVSYYKELGCLIAIDDFGSGESNFDRLWRIGPHIVKLDRSIIAQAAGQIKVKRVLPSLVKLIHETGSLALMEGIESGEEAMISMDSGADFVQGYYFAKPSERISDAARGVDALRGLCDQFRHVALRESEQHRRMLHPYMASFGRLVDQFMGSGEMKLACADFLSLSKAERCYVLDEKGRQLGMSHLPVFARFCEDPRFKPLHDASDAVWIRRHYFRRAMQSPGEIQTSRPYLSIASGNMCVTLSVAVDSGGKSMVLCGDIQWDD